MMSKLFPKLGALAVAIAIGLVAMIVAQHPSRAVALDLESFVEQLKGPEWIGPWYSEMIANRGGEQPVQPHPQYVALPSYPAWTWIEGTDQGSMHRVASPGGSITQVGVGDFDDLSVSRDHLGTPVVGIITDFGGVKNAFDILEMSATGWNGHMINMPGYVPSMLKSGRAVSQDIDAKVYSFVYDELDRVYLAYRSTLPELTDEVSGHQPVIVSSDSNSLDLIDQNETKLLREVQTKIETNESLMKELRDWLEKNFDPSKNVSLKQLLENGTLQYPDVLAVLIENNFDFVVADRTGKLAPEAFLQYPLVSASWSRPPLDLQLGMVAASHSAQPRNDLFIFVTSESSYPVSQKQVVTTHCQLQISSYGNLIHNCSPGYGLPDYLYFDSSDDVELMNSSSVPGWLRHVVLVQSSDGSSRIITVKNEVMSDIFWYEPRRFSEYASSGTISSASVLSLSKDEFMLALVEDGELKVFLVNDATLTSVFNPWPTPVSAAQSFQSVDLYREGDAMVMVAVTTDNQIWKFMANVPGTIWTP